MNHRALSASLVVLAIIGGAAAFLRTQSRRQHLGKPGVRVAAKMVYGFDELAPTNAPFFVASNSVALPERVIDYRSRADLIGKLTLDTLPKDTMFGRRIYFHGDEPPITCQVVLMGSDRTSIHKPQYCLKGMGLQITSSKTTNVRIERPHPYDLPVMRLHVRGEGRDSEGNRQAIGGVFVYWFVADNELTASHVDRMWWMARDMLLSGVLQRWAYVIYFTPCPVGNEEMAFERLKDFIAASVPEYQLTAGPPLAMSRAASD